MTKLNYDYNSPVEQLRSAKNVLKNELASLSKEERTKERLNEIYDEMYDIDNMINKKLREEKQGAYIHKSSMSAIYDAFNESL